jgi:cytoskeleton protein RodZ
VILSGMGELLRRQRVDRKLTFDEISRATKISTRFLQAIEAENLESLPGLIFTRNFVRQYASFMELDPESLLAKLPRFDLESAPMPQPPDRPRRRSWDRGWSSTFASMAWTLLACGAAVGAYMHFNRSLHPFTIVEAAARQPSEAPPERSSSVSTPPSSSTSGDGASANHAVQVVVAAREESWVQAIADGKSVFAGTLKAGETRSIAADDHVSVRTGNAGGVEISLNGKPLDPLGPSGQIRSITLTAGGPRLPSAVPSPQNPPSESVPF